MDDDVAAAVRGLLPGLAERAPGVDVAGEISGSTMTELIDVGVFRMLQPKWCGGLETDPIRFYDVVRAIAGVCGSTGWVASVLGVHPWHVALFDERAQQDVWSARADTLICSSYAPVGRLVPVEGGYELSGHWRSASGCTHASWALLSGVVMADHGQPVEIATALVPRADYRIENVWDVVGLRGTGSDDLHADRVFVPEYRTLRNYDVALRRGPGQKLNSGPLYRLPFGTMFSYAMTAPIIGLAEGCLETFLARMRDRNRLSFGGGSLTSDQFTQVAAARAASEVDAAALQLVRNIRDLYECARRREDIPMELRLRARRDQVCGTERSVRAIDLVFAAAGGMARRSGDPIERAWRDAHTGSAHAANDVESSLALVGRGAFGLYVDDTLV
ncbi:acyl-CoA dehydrogenase family protein [Nocardia sp. NBC_00565]|uniref:3-hydroxy-9,10-secoandrosta-1,3,5(10)-triene-9, 17-dione monooxygenase oxygenase subunit n=1 Tax=Nocardia sp. NBC_00565 TaxID=2975993 RepID=UPI002E811B12|nr:3-hydroxy-9,10-secoandrosta-1,3,5(10)-triene-9,17-dione monooxygenase oxygenase subunit [Nocardia sp. NBC_00565]WUC06367.1 acyl-CoA dehydrogenase family protein [Nocardia sp. NBC_00565]